MAGRDVLRVLWSEGVRVTRRPDGSLGLAPPERVTADIRQLARDAKGEFVNLPAMRRARSRPSSRPFPPPGYAQSAADPTATRPPRRRIAPTAGCLPPNASALRTTYPEWRPTVRLELQCRECGRSFSPSKTDILSGRYRLCEECRPTDQHPPAPAGVPIAEPSAA
jgi:hypothetical protein